MNEARDAAIVQMHVDDRLTLTEIGKRMGLTRERIRQIVRKAGVTVAETQGVLRDNCMPTLEEFECENCGRKVVRRQTYRRSRYCGYDCHVAAQRAESVKYAARRRVVLLEHLKALGERLGRVPGVRDVIEASPPSHVGYYKYFGSMREAQRQAGFQPNSTGFQHK